MTTETQSSNTSVARLQIPWAGLATALIWAISPIFVRLGLTQLPSPLIGVSIGMTTNMVIYGLLLWMRRGEWRGKVIPPAIWRWQLMAAVFVALATWARWVALDTVPVAIVTSIERISVPLVILLSILLLDQQHERVNLRVWIGGLMIVGGAILLTLAP